MELSRHLLPFTFVFMCTALLSVCTGCSDSPPQSRDAGFQSREPFDGGDTASDAGVRDAARVVDMAIDSGLDAARSPCLITDTDGDGFGTDPSCQRVDCDDENPSVHPDSFEACNGLDDDCDTRVDEGLGDRVCGEGACMVSVDNCVDGEAAVCTPRSPERETCNAIDDDCDGQLDEDVDAVRCGVGACERSATCLNGALERCVPGEPVAESCNGADDDCDGTVDNGFRARIIVSTYTDLGGHHPACDGSGERIGPSCNAAMNRFCRAQACGSTGFGPAENSGDIAHVTCISGANPHRVPFDTLWQHHEDCRGPQEAMSGPCYAAIHRYCQSRGQVTGFGPAELGANEMFVVCLESAVQVVQTTYTAVSQHHGPCDGDRQRVGPDCNAAIKRWCTSQGFVSGFGPLENSGDTLFVACLSD